MADNAADVTIQGTLNDKATGDINLAGILVPSYSVTMYPDAYRYGYPNMGDNCPFIAKVGRLNINSLPPSGGLRVLGITYDIGDDGQENIELTLGRPLRSLAELFTQADRDVDALARR